MSIQILIDISVVFCLEILCLDVCMYVCMYVYIWKSVTKSKENTQTHTRTHTQKEGGRGERFFICRFTFQMFNSQIWTSQKPGTRNSSGMVSHMVSKYFSHILLSSQEHKQEAKSEVEHLRLNKHLNMRCQCCKLQHSPLHHNASPGTILKKIMFFP